ncbi:hypothetical protein [Candidatus Sodalis pierantonius]|uniref:hypothetical protein n=1 Tax=Candidatus Sodalis pierantonii TaxID=1486991 RepID=UPI00046CA28D|nr:hypothetical protein [Candidatus Sodalis pierantonius]
MISVADDDGELLRTSLRLLPPAGEKARARMDAEGGSPAQAEFIADIEANARSARNPASEAFVQANASARAGAKADAKTDTESAINAELVFTCFPASQAPVTTLLTVAGGRLIQLSRGPTGERILCRIAYHPTLGVIQQVNLSGGVCESFGYAEDAVFPLVNGHTTTVSDGDNRLYCLTETFSISHSDTVAPNPTRHHHPGATAEAPPPYQSVITRILPMPAENVLHSDDGAPEIQTIIHRYNRLHLLVTKEEIRETQVCGQRRRGRTSTQWAYYCDDALALADQSARYALAREKRVTWDENGPVPNICPAIAAKYPAMSMIMWAISSSMFIPTAAANASPTTRRRGRNTTPPSLRALSASSKA